jgi:RNA polymerase sigma-70 factor (ECF subfamily)
MDLVTGSTAIVDYIEGFRRESQNGEGTPAASSAGERQRIASLDDAHLVEQSVAGNSIAFDQLVERYRSKVVRLVSSTLGSDIDPEDVAQDVFVKVYLSLGRFRGESSFSTYLYTVTVNRCRDELRKGKLRKFFSFDEWFSGNNPAHPTQENGEGLEMDERRSAVRSALKKLPTQSQMLLHLREIEELSYKELADIFEVEIGTIKSRLARARDRLRDELEPYIAHGVLPGARRMAEGTTRGRK